MPLSPAPGTSSALTCLPVHALRLGLRAGGVIYARIPCVGTDVGALSEHLLNEYMSFYLCMCFSLFVKQVMSRLLNFILRAMRIFLTSDYYDPVWT